MITKVLIAIIPLALLISCATVHKPEPQIVQIDMFIGQGESYNTFTGKHTKNAMTAPTVTTPFSLTSEEQVRILRTAKKVDFFAMHDTIPDNPRGVMLPDNPMQHLRIQIDAFDKTVIWHQPDFKFNPECFRLRELLDTVQNITAAAAASRR